MPVGVGCVHGNGGGAEGQLEGGCGEALAVPALDARDLGQVEGRSGIEGVAERHEPLAAARVGVGPAAGGHGAGPFAQARFCPTGGIDIAKAPAYLALPNVACVGGSWMLPADALKAKDWTRIGDLAREAAALGH